MAEYTLESGLEMAWATLVAGAAHRKHGFHAFTLATVDPDGLPSARTVILQRADPTTRTFTFHIDIRSPKARELRDGATVCCLFYGRAEKLQVRIRGTVRLHHGDEVSQPVWDGMKPFSQETYATPLAPGTECDNLERPDPLPYEVARENFAVCRVTVASLEWLSLAVTGHARARYDWSENGAISARWLAP